MIDPTHDANATDVAVRRARRTLSRALLAAAVTALLVSATSATAPQAALPGVATQPALPLCATCAWTVASADALIAEIAASAAEGLDPAAYDTAGLRMLADRVGPSPELDRTAEAAALLLARHYLFGRVADRARQSWYIARSDDPAALKAALRQRRVRPWLRSLLPSDARYVALRDAYVALPGDAGEDRARVRDNLERWRWLPRELGPSHILVNVPSYTLAVVDGGVATSSYDVVVGAPATPTPQIAASARTVVINPAWPVPPSIVRS